MGNGSPRLLSRFVRRTVLVGLAALYFAPSAFADDAIVAVSVYAGPVDVSVSVEAPSAPAPTEAPVAPVTAVASSLPATDAAVQATVDARSPVIPVAVATAPARAVSAAPAQTPPSRKRLLSNKKPAGQRAAALGPAGSSRIGASVRGPFPKVPRASSLVREPAPRAPQPQIPAPSGVGLEDSNGAGTPPGAGLLLFALAAGLALLRAPRLGPRISLQLSTPRPHAHLLQLERPD
jgi:hypothetical protein